jgi:transcription-repair coupling factor (superfamily II helicase)
MLFFSDPDADQNALTCIKYYIISEKSKKASEMSKKMQKKWCNAVLRFLRQAPAEAPVLSGVSEAVAPVLLFREFLADPERPLLVAVPDLSMAERTVLELNSWSRCTGIALRVRLLPETLHGKMVFTGGEAGRARELLASLTEPTDILVGSVHALTAACPPPEKLLNSEFTLRPGMKISPAELAEKLVKLDYDDELEVHVSGEFSRRGGNSLPLGSSSRLST